MNRLFVLATGALLASATAFAGPLEELAARVSPRLEGRVTFQLEPGRADIEVGPKGSDGMVIKAADTRLAAAGLGCYLRTMADAHWSWCESRLSGLMPTPLRAQTFTPAYPHVLAYNYCTLSYTMAFWDTAAWRQEIDHLALYGVDLPLVQAGLPAVWQGMLRELGYPEERIAAFIPDEAAAAWWNMGNLEGLGGPLPQAMIDANAEVGRFIVKETTALGMKPILQAFTGLVPSDLPNYLSKEDYPDARWIEQGEWVDGFQRPTLLDPTTEAFQKLATLWYKHLFAVYGITRAEAFAGDLFHEGGRTGGVDVTASARAVQAAQQKASPGAIWMIQAWHANPSEALLKGLDPRYAMIQALVKDQADGHHYRRSFGEVPWLWCELVNFGGKHNLCGGAMVMGGLGELTRMPGAKTLQGFGFLSEGMETTPLIYELFADRFFTGKHRVFTADDMDAWLTLYATRRYGLCNSTLHDGLRALVDSVYNLTGEQEGCCESIVCARPSWEARKASSWSNGEPYYSPAYTLRAAEAYFRVAKASPRLLTIPTFRYDVADTIRQALADIARPLLAKAKDDPAAQEAFLELIRHTDAVCSVTPMLRLEFYEARAKRYGGDSAVAAYRRMITTWSGRRGSLNDYAHRQLAGLISHYYLKRWEAFFDTQANGGDFNARLDALDATFTSADLPPTPTPKNPLVPLREAMTFLRTIARENPNFFALSSGVPWALNGTAGTTTLTHSVSEFIPEAGTYIVDIRWKRGIHALKIDKVELYEGDRIVASDKHPGHTGYLHEANVYTLHLPHYRTGLEDYTLRITGHGDGGGDSAGTFTITRAP